MRSLSRKFILLAICLLSAGSVFAQQDGPQRFDQQPPNDERPNVLAKLGLSKEQVQQFRRTNAEHRPIMQAAQQRLREANRDLDMSIYADNVSDADFRTKLKVFQEAQFEVNRLRFTNELAIRKILTPEQLMRFREMRRRFAEAGRERMQQQRRNQQVNPRSIDNQPKQQNQMTKPANRLNRPIS